MAPPLPPDSISIGHQSCISGLVQVLDITLLASLWVEIHIPEASHVVMPRGFEQDLVVVIKPQLEHSVAVCVFFPVLDDIIIIGRSLVDVRGQDELPPIFSLSQLTLEPV